MRPSRFPISYDCRTGAFDAEVVMASPEGSGTRGHARSHVAPATHPEVPAAAIAGRRASPSRTATIDMEEMVKMLTEKTILIGYDNSEGSRRAIAAAGELFPGYRTIVLHVWSPVSLMVAAYGGMVALPTYDDDALQEAAKKFAQEGCRLAIEAGLRAQPETAEVTYQGAWYTILEVADQYDAALIVLGARGLSGFKSMVLGSVSHSVAQHAHVPVLVVPPAAHEKLEAEPAEHAAATA